MIGADSWPALAGAALLGLAGSTHCLGMCGGIAAAAGTRAQTAGFASPGIVFNLARVLSYALLGAFVGALTGAVLAQAPGRPAAMALRGLAGLLMLAMGVSLLTGRGLSPLEQLGGRLWQRVRPLAARAMSLPATVRLAALGLLWGFLPCGLVYSALALAAASGSAGAGAATMLAFGAGTLPTMIAVTLAGAAFTRVLGGQRTRRVAGVLMVLFAAWTVAGLFTPRGAHHGSGEHHSGGHAPAPGSLQPQTGRENG